MCSFVVGALREIVAALLGCGIYGVLSRRKQLGSVRAFESHQCVSLNIAFTVGTIGTVVGTVVFL